MTSKVDNNLNDTNNMKKLFLMLLCAAFAMVGCEDLDIGAIQDILDSIETPEDPVFVVDKDGDYIIAQEGGEVEVVVLTNLEYYVSIPDEAKEWVSLADTRAIRQEKLHFAVAENISGSERRATIEMKSMEGEVLQSVDFVQQSASSELPESYTITLKASDVYLNIGGVVTFTVLDNEGNDVTSLSRIYDAASLEALADATFTAMELGRYEFFASYKGVVSESVTVIVVASTILQVPEDHNPNNLAFHHRPILILHSGMNCGYCPYALDYLKQLEATEWNGRYNEVSCHAGAYASGDPANSQAANTLNSFQSSLVSGYPTVIVNFYTSIGDYRLNSMRSGLSKVWKESGADVGVAMAVAKGDNEVICSAQIKAAVEQEYCVNVWLLENGIYSPNQTNATKDYHKIYNHAIRNTSEFVSKTSFEGLNVGVLAAGERYNYSCSIPITKSSWVVDNMEALMVVSAKNGNGKWEIVNSVCCPINKSVGFQYLGESANMGDVEFSGPSNVDKLASPNVYVESVSDTSFTIAWEPVENATEYNVMMNNDIYETTETFMTFDDLYVGVYSVWVKATAPGYEDSAYSMPIDVYVMGPSSVDWFKQSVYLPEDNEENAKREINSSNTIQFRWWGDGVESLRYMFYDANNLPATDEDIIYEMYDLDKESLSSVNSAEGVEFMFRELTGGKTYVLYALATKGDKEFFVKDEITTNDTILTLGTEAWLGQCNAYTPQIVDVTTNTFRDERTDFTLTITPYENYSNCVWVDGFSVLGEGAPAFGVVYHENVNGEYTGNYILELMCYETIGELGEGSGVYAVWLPYCSIEGGDYAFIHGSFGAYTLTLNPTTGAVTCEAYKGPLSDGRSFEVKMMDLFGLNTSNYECFFMTNEEGNEITEYKAGGLMGMSKQPSIFPLSRTATRKMRCSDIPASVVVSM